MKRLRSIWEVESARLATVWGDRVVVPLSEILNMVRVDPGGVACSQAKVSIALLMGERTSALTAQVQTHLDPFG